MGVLMTKVGRKNWNVEVSGNCGDPFAQFSLSPFEVF